MFLPRLKLAKLAFDLSNSNRWKAELTWAVVSEYLAQHANQQATVGVRTRNLQIHKTPCYQPTTNCNLPRVAVLWLAIFCFLLFIYLFVLLRDRSSVRLDLHYSYFFPSVYLCICPRFSPKLFSWFRWNVVWFLVQTVQQYENLIYMIYRHMPFMIYLRPSQLICMGVKYSCCEPVAILIAAWIYPHHQHQRNERPSWPE